MNVYRWTIYTIVIPLSPLLVVAAISSQPEKAIPYEGILGGTEIFLLCLFITSTTYRDWDIARERLAQSHLRECLRLALEFWLYGLGVMSAFVFLHVHVQDLGLPAQFVANTGIVFGTLTTALCLTAQVLLANGEKAKRKGVATPVVR